MGEDSGEHELGGIGSVCELSWFIFSLSSSHLCTPGVDVLGSSVFIDGWTMSNLEMSAYLDSKSEDDCS